jgi:hypothetical protein
MLKIASPTKVLTVVLLSERKNPPRESIKLFLPRDETID